MWDPAASSLALVLAPQGLGGHLDHPRWQQGAPSATMKSYIAGGITHPQPELGVSVGRSWLAGTAGEPPHLPGLS